MKRGVILELVVFCALFGLFVFTAPSVSAASNTSEPDWNSSEQVYEINTVQELQYMDNDLDNDYVLTSDIDASETQSWNGGKGFEPIGPNSPDSFVGFFNGNDYVIEDLYIDRPNSEHIGLFGYADNEDEVIVNVGLKDVDITGDNFVGGLIGYANVGNVDNCYSAGSVSGYQNVGGLVGYANVDNVDNCYSAGSVSGHRDVGGLVGRLDIGTYTTRIRESYSSASVSSSYFDDTIIGTGGLVGYDYDGSIILRCYFTGDLDSAGRPSTGGLLGVNNGEVINSYSTGDVNGGDDMAARNGGLIGLDYGKITKSYSVAETVTGSNSGGLVGETYAQYENVFWDNEICNQNQDHRNGNLENVYAESTEPMMTESTFTSKGWDFDTVWGIGSYPYLLSNEQSPHPDLEMTIGGEIFSTNLIEIWLPYIGLIILIGVLVSVVIFSGKEWLCKSE